MTLLAVNPSVSMAEANGGNPSTPEQLFHTTLTVVDFHRDTSGSTREVHVLGTHTTLPAAKEFALTAVQHLGYQPDDFTEYATQADTPESWKHGDGVMVYAKAPGGQEFLVGLDTKPNNESLPAGPQDTPLLPEGHKDLHYVLQNRTDYKQDKSGVYQTTEIQGCYARREDALAAAKAALEEDREEYAQYDKREDDNLRANGEWPFGDEVFVRAVAQTGENYTVAVKTVPGAHEKYRKKGRARMRK